MIVASASIEIKRPRIEVFDFVANHDNTPLWQAGVIQIAGPSGMTVGATYEVQMHFLGRAQRSTFEVLENDGLSYTKAHSTRGPLKYETTQRFEELSSRRTRISINVRIDAGSVFKLAEPALHSITLTVLEANLKTLKILLESTPKSSA
jgi:hypothetical protein